MSTWNVDMGCKTPPISEKYCCLCPGGKRPAWQGVFISWGNLFFRRPISSAPCLIPEVTSWKRSQQLNQDKQSGKCRGCFGHWFAGSSHSAPIVPSPKCFIEVKHFASAFQSSSEARSFFPACLRLYSFCHQFC